VGSDADDPGVGTDERVRGVLERDLARLKAGDPVSVLGLTAGAGAQDIRARYLALVKRYHPTRYARRPREVVKLANEIFLRVKVAYEQASGSREAPRAGQPTGRQERLSSGSQPRLEVDAALARRRRLRSYPVLPATGTQPVETVTPDEMAERVKQRDEERVQRRETAINDLRAGRLEQARDGLRALLAETPTDKQVRMLLHYTLGREHHALGRSEAARSEYERALAIDPRFEPAQKSLALLAPKDPEDDRGGLLSRWFKR
jgi:tetratricopeptide (TPR) repeat protein